LPLSVSVPANRQSAATARRLRSPPPECGYLQLIDAETPVSGCDDNPPCRQARAILQVRIPGIAREPVSALFMFVVVHVPSPPAALVPSKLDRDARRQRSVDLRRWQIQQALRLQEGLDPSRFGRAEAAAAVT